VLCYVHAVNSAPTLASQSYSILMDRALTVNASAGILAGAADANGDPLTVQLVTNTTHGDLSLSPDGSFIYSPQTGFVGIDTFAVVASDGQATSSPATTMTINVTGKPPPATIEPTIQSTTAITRTFAGAHARADISTHVFNGHHVGAGSPGERCIHPSSTQPVATVVHLPQPCMRPLHEACSFTCNVGSAMRHVLLLSHMKA
jgi:VCBS repeat-containing protein